MSALQLHALRVGYAGGDVLRGVSLIVQPGECVAVLGANGAGKTTLLRACSGMLKPRGGSIRIFDRAPRRYAAPEFVRMAVAHVPEGRGTIATLSVEENLRVGAVLRSDRAEVEADLDHFYGHFPVLRSRRSAPATSLSGGEQQMLAISRALMCRPRILLLDEPSFGLAPKIIRDVYAILRQIIAERQIALLLVEQTIDLALSIVSRACVLQQGVIVAESDAASLRGSDTLRKAYLGSTHV
jgi:branched-chain amino acid transport system ATP-binding protein